MGSPEVHSQEAIEQRPMAQRKSRGGAKAAWMLHGPDLQDRFGRTSPVAVFL